MNHSLNIAFLIGSAELNLDYERSYQKTITSYRLAFGGAFGGVPVAYVKLPENQKDLLPDVIDFLYDSDVKPVVALEGFDAKVFPQQERVKDIHKLLSHPNVTAHAFTLLVAEGRIVSSDQFVNCLTNAAAVLDGNPDILSVAFEGAGAAGHPAGQFVAFKNLTSRPAVVRTRDMMIAAKWAVDNAAQLGGLSSEQSLSHMLGTMSYHPYKHLAFPPNVGYSI